MSTILFITGPVSSQQITQLTHRYVNNGDLQIVTELQHFIPKDTNLEYKVLDSLRTPELTVRDAADKAEQSLLSIRKIFEDRFAYRGHSLWLANETNFLHFRLLRAVDTVAVLKNHLKKERATKVICVGALCGLTQCVDLVAKSLNIPCHIEHGGGMRGFLNLALWRFQRAASRAPFVYFIVVYLAAIAKSLVRRYRIKSEYSKTSSSASELRKKTIVFLGTDIKQSDVTTQLYRFLEKQPLYQCRMLSLSSPSLAEHYLQHDLVADYLPVWGSARMMFNRFLVRTAFMFQLCFVGTSALCRKEFEYIGVDMWPVTMDIIARNILIGAVNLVTVVEETRSYLKDHPAEFVVTPGEWNLTSRAAIIGAKSVGVKTISVQRGDITDFPGWGDPIFSDHFTVNGYTVREALVKNRVPLSQISVIGDPRFDPWVVDRHRFFTGNIRKNFGINTEAKIVAVMTNPVNLNERESHSEQYITSLMKLTFEMPEIFLVIKLHPSEKSTALYKKIEQETCAKNVCIIQDFNTPQLLFDSDVVVTTISTTGEEAIFLEKPLVVVNLTNEPGFMPYEGSTAAITVRDESCMKQALKDALYSDRVKESLAAGRQQYIEQHMFSNDGRSSERFETLLSQLSSKVGSA